MRSLLASWVAVIATFFCDSTGFAKQPTQAPGSDEDRSGPTKAPSTAIPLPSRLEQFTRIETIAVGDFAVDLCLDEDGAFGLGEIRHRALLLRRADFLITWRLDGKLPSFKSFSEKLGGPEFESARREVRQVVRDFGRVRGRMVHRFAHADGSGYTWTNDRDRSKVVWLLKPATLPDGRSGQAVQVYVIQ